MGRLQARAGLSSIVNVEEQSGHRVSLARLYDDLFAQRGWPVIPSIGADEPRLLYPVRVQSKNELVRKARTRLLDITAWWSSPLGLSGDTASEFGYPFGACLRAEAAYAEIVGLPLDCRITPGIAEKLVDFVVSESAPALSV